MDSSVLQPFANETLEQRRHRIDGSIMAKRIIIKDDCGNFCFEYLKLFECKLSTVDMLTSQGNIGIELIDLTDLDGLRLVNRNGIGTTIIIRIIVPIQLSFMNSRAFHLIFFSLRHSFNPVLLVLVGFSVRHFLLFP